MRKFEIDENDNYVPDVVENSGPVQSFKRKSKTTQILMVIAAIIAVALIVTRCNGVGI